MAIAIRAIHMELTGPIELSITQGEGPFDGRCGVAPSGGLAEDSGDLGERSSNKSSVMVSPQLINYAVPLSATDAIGFASRFRFSFDSPTWSARGVVLEWNAEGTCPKDSLNSAK
jgi:hypothetical protein